MSYTLRMPEAVDVDTIMEHFDDDIDDLVSPAADLRPRRKTPQLTDWPKPTTHNTLNRSKLSLWMKGFSKWMNG